MKKIESCRTTKNRLETIWQKDLNYELQIDCLPSVTLKNFEKFKATSFKVKIDSKIIEEN